ncbi:hypothetical protein FB45DRAFT_1006392 [Roridomyces roridus]|uniref:Uncharacterized protein n=1 Tax=Roridomyces roridus TaxID=1738132 RepID=A0AAD7FIZ5_9AGAR|nr:hypothetical protein FB45DRAFT_1006392 [Roridomyces roridus]
MTMLATALRPRDALGVPTSGALGSRSRRCEHLQRGLRPAAGNLARNSRSQVFAGKYSSFTLSSEVEVELNLCDVDDNITILKMDSVFCDAEHTYRPRCVESLFVDLIHVALRFHLRPPKLERGITESRGSRMLKCTACLFSEPQLPRRSNVQRSSSHLTTWLCSPPPFDDGREVKLTLKLIRIDAGGGNPLRDRRTASLNHWHLLPVFGGNADEHMAFAESQKICIRSYGNSNSDCSDQDASGYSDGCYFCASFSEVHTDCDVQLQSETQRVHSYQLGPLCVAGHRTHHGLFFNIFIPELGSREDLISSILSGRGPS